MSYNCILCLKPEADYTVGISLTVWGNYTDITSNYKLRITSYTSSISHWYCVCDKCYFSTSRSYNMLYTLLCSTKIILVVALLSLFYCLIVLAGEVGKRMDCIVLTAVFSSWIPLGVAQMIYVTSGLQRRIVLLTLRKVLQLNITRSCVK